MIEMLLGKLFNAVEVDSLFCDGCFFDNNNRCNLGRPNVFCGSEYRNDGKNVIYKEAVDTN